MDKEEQQKKLIELQIISQQLNQMQQQLSALQAQSEDVRNLQKSLDEIEKTKVGNKILAPLSSGVLIDTELKNNKEVVMAIGAGITVKKPISEAKKIIKDQENQLDLIMNKLQQDLQHYSSVYIRLEEELSQEK